MTDNKLWWQSRTIWLNLIAVLFALGASLKLLPDGLTQEEVLSAVMGLVGTIGLVLRFITKTPIA